MGRAVILKLYLAPLSTTLYNPETIVGSSEPVGSHFIISISFDQILEEKKVSKSFVVVLYRHASNML